MAAGFFTEPIHFSLVTRNAYMRSACREHLDIPFHLGWSTGNDLNMEEKVQPARDVKKKDIVDGSTKWIPFELSLALPSSTDNESKLGNPAEANSREADHRARAMLSYAVAEVLPRQKVQSLHVKVTRDTEVEAADVRIRRLFYPVYVAECETSGFQYETVVDGMEGMVIPRLSFLNPWAFGASGMVGGQLLMAPFWMVNAEGLFEWSLHAVRSIGLLGYNHHSSGPVVVSHVGLRFIRDSVDHCQGCKPLPTNKRRGGSKDPSGPGAYWTTTASLEK